MLGAGAKPACGRTQPCTVAGVDHATYVDAYWSGTGAACAVVRTGAVYCWGTAPGFSHTAKRVMGFSRAVRVSVGPAHVCIVDDRRQARCIERQDRWSPDAGDAFFSAPSTAIAGLPPVKEVVIQHGHGCARTVDNKVMCWGQNQVGQLGTGDTRSRERPVLVAAPRSDIKSDQHDSDNVCEPRRKGRRMEPSDAQIYEALAPIWKQIQNDSSIDWPAEPIEYVVFDHTGALVDLRLAPELYPPAHPGHVGPLAWVVASLLDARVPGFCRRRVRIEHPISRLRLETRRR
jgi:hypothetical protein